MVSIAFLHVNLDFPTILDEILYLMSSALCGRRAGHHWIVIKRLSTRIQFHVRYIFSFQPTSMSNVPNFKLTLHSDRNEGVRGRHWSTLHMINIKEVSRCVTYIRILLELLLHHKNMTQISRQDSGGKHGHCAMQSFQPCRARVSLNLRITQNILFLNNFAFEQIASN